MHVQNDLKNIAAHFFSYKNDHGMRNRTCQLLLHHNVMRWDNGKMIELPDIFSLLCDDEGPQQCLAVVMNLRQGKTNKYGRLEYNGMFRNKDVRICGVGALAMWFFWRFHVMNEPCPDFSDPKAWFHIKVIPSPKNSKEEYDYNAHYSAISKAFDALKICSTNKAHAARHAGIQHAQST